MELCERPCPSGDSILIHLGQVDGRWGEAGTGWATRYRMATLTPEGARALVIAVFTALCPPVLGESDGPQVARGASASSSDEELGLS